MPRRPPAPARRRPGRPPADRPVLSPARIADAADALMARDGWAALSMRGLAAALGVDPMAIYRHLPSKAAVGALVLARRLERLGASRPTGRGHRAAAAAPAMVTRRVLAVATRYLELIADAPGLVGELLADAGAAAPLATRWASLIEEAVAGAGLPTGRRRTLAHTLADFIHGYALAPTGRNAAAFGRSVRLIVAGGLAGE